MFRNHLFALAILGISFLSSCIIPGTRRERAEMELERNDSLLVIDEGDFRFRMALPKDLMIANEPRIHNTSDGTTLYIECGSNFQVRVTLPSNPVSAQKFGSEQEGIFNHQLIDCENESCIFKRILPDGVSFDYGLYQITTVGETTYVFQSAPTGEFDLNSVMRMKLALDSVKI